MAKKATNTTGTATAPPVKPTTVDAQSAQQMFEAIGIMLVFIIVLTMIADTGPNAGHVAVVLMVGLLIVQGVMHVNPFVTWVNKHPLIPGQSTFTVGS